MDNGGGTTVITQTNIVAYTRTPTQCELGARCSAKGWGTSYSSGALAQPPDRVDYVSVSQGLTHGLGILNSGYLVAWGDVGGVIPPELQGQGQTPIQVKQALAGNKSSVVLSKAGQVYAFGSNQSAIVSQLPLSMQFDGTVAKICISYDIVDAACALRTTGEVQCWGSPLHFVGPYADLWCGSDQLAMVDYFGAFLWQTWSVPDAPQRRLVERNILYPPTSYDRVRVAEVAFASYADVIVPVGRSMDYWSQYQTTFDCNVKSTIGYQASAFGSILTFISEANRTVSLCHNSSSQTPASTALLTVPTDSPAWQVSTQAQDAVLLYQAGCSVFWPSATNPTLAPAPAPIFSGFTFTNSRLSFDISDTFYGIEETAQEFRTIQVRVNGAPFYAWTVNRVGPTRSSTAIDSFNCSYVDSYSASWTNLATQNWVRSYSTPGHITYTGELTVVWTDTLKDLTGITRQSSFGVPITLTFPNVITTNSTDTYLWVDTLTHTVTLITYTPPPLFPLNSSGIVTISFALKGTYPVRSVLGTGTAPHPFVYSATGTTSDSCDVGPSQAVGSWCSQVFDIVWTVPAGTCQFGGTYTQSFTRGCYANWTGAPCPLTQPWNFTYTLPTMDYCAKAMNRTFAATANMTVAAKTITMGSILQAQIGVSITDKSAISVSLQTCSLIHSGVTTGNPWYNRTIIEGYTWSTLAQNVNATGDLYQVPQQPSKTFNLALAIPMLVGTDPTLAVLNSATDANKATTFNLECVVKVASWQGFQRKRRRSEGEDEEEKDGIMAGEESAFMVSGGFEFDSGSHGQGHKVGRREL